jgi:hypothetical protein
MRSIGLEKSHRLFDRVSPLRRILASSVEDLMVFSCFGSGDPQHSHPRSSDESETFIIRLRRRRFQRNLRTIRTPPLRHPPSCDSPSEGKRESFVIKSNICGGQGDAPLGLPPPLGESGGHTHQFHNMTDRFGEISKGSKKNIVLITGHCAF